MNPLMAAFDPLRTLEVVGILKTMRVPTLRIIGFVLAALALGSCSYSYNLLAVAIDGRLAFIVDPSSSHDPDCVNSIHVSTDNGETATAKAAAGDDEKLVANGVFWWKSMERDCKNSFPIFYGQPLKGERLVYGDGVPAYRGKSSSVVEAKPLHVGVVYEVSTSSGATGYGEGWFRITADRRVENWREDPTPESFTVVLNDQ